MFKHRWKVGKSTLSWKPDKPVFIRGVETFPGCFIIAYRGFMIQRYLP